MQELTGITEAWKEFSSLDPLEVCARASITYNDSLQLYTISSFGQDIFISLSRQEVFSDSPEGKSLIGIKDYFFDLSVLWYLIRVRNIPLTDNLIKPADVPGGQIFVKGTHVLPMDAIAQKFNHQKELFLAVGSKYGAVEMDYGDVAVKLLPFPKVPVYLILWFGNEDFPPSGQLLLDPTCSSHLSTDVIWAVTMVCCLLILRHS